MAEWFVGPVMDKIINTCSDYLENQVRSQKSMKKELERLRENHPKIQAVVFAANQAQINNENAALNKWIWQLRDAIDEADDLLDEFEYIKHREQITTNMEETKKRKVTSFLFESAHKILKVGEGVLKIDPKLKRLEEAVQKLDKVSADVGTFLHLLESTKQEQHEQELEFYKIRETGSLPKNDLIGRGKDKEFLMQWLRKPSNEEHQALINGTDLFRNISLLSIVGHGGMGKTTLLQHVYEDEMTNEFDLKMWVCISNNFDVKKVIADMLENRPPLDSLDALQKSLKSEMMSKKFLLVLDDIWENDEERDKSKWENVLAPLAYGSFGSKILVTTRMDSVALTIAKVIKKKKETFRLEGLEEDECLQLLNSHAFADVVNPNEYKRLRSIAREIVKKLSGSPLAAKVIGGVLNSSLDERHWTKVLNSDFVSAELGKDGIFLILRLSYMFLPKCLQNCFAFCCIFPQDHSFDKDDLVRMWIALGFIRLSHIQGETMEDIGGKYFDVLVKKSFFDKFLEINKRTFYKMHDLLHELGQSVSIQECLRVVDSKELPSIIPETIRHLSVKTRNLDVLRKIANLKNLHTLCITYGNDDQDFIDVLATIFKTSRSIRLLCIDFSPVKMIPEVIGYLTHLRYLRLCYTRVNMLPRSLSNLYHLHFIIIRDRWFSIRNDFLPRDINNLTNLHYLELPWDSFPGIHEIGKLKSLQELNGFYLRNESGYRIGELKYMNDLRKLRIKFLENVKDAEEACNIKLCDKKNLTNLSLEWGDIEWRSLINLYETVLDNLQPQNCLKNLSIRKYMGARSAIWMNNARLIYNIEYISLENCMEWQNLPPFGQLPFLKLLQLRYMPKVKRIDNKFHGNDKFYVFPSLEVLKIEGLEALEDWFDKGVDAAASDCFFPCLTELKLKDCPKLEELPSLPPKLKSLIIDNVGWKTLNFCSMPNSIPLISLVVSRCPDITYIPLADEVERLAALRYLTIKDCPNLISLGVHQEVGSAGNCQLILKDLSINNPSVLLMEPLRSITSLKNLTIDRNDELVSFSNETEQWFLKVSSSLCVLGFTYLHSLQSIPSSLPSLSLLKSLYVRNVTQLQLLPNIPSSLERLELHHLESLQYLPSSLSTISSLKYLDLEKIPLLKSLPDLPTSLCNLSLRGLENMDCLPSSLPTLSSLKKIYINEAPQLRGLPELPSSLYELCLCDLSNLDCLPSCLSNLTSLHRLHIYKTPQLRELPDLPPSLKFLTVRKCHPELKERYRMVEGYDWHKIAHIPKVDMSTD